MGSKDGLAECRGLCKADSPGMEDNKQAPALPLFKDGEIKKIALGFREIDGKVEITLTSRGMNDDINEMATMLAFALEKILDA